jgi:hypothetical protein
MSGMCRIARLRVVALALMLVASQAALACHTAAHFSPDLEKCELCVSHAQLLTAVPVADQGFEADPYYGAPTFDSPGLMVPEKRVIPHRQRAPPIPSM